ncbi:MAG: hypothetical protein SFU53_13600 [Terrimicrobiaceae bacterium]|nr:hypothetical protein [Terrimicrobiaceae bacterium]
MPNEFIPPLPPEASPVSTGFGSSINEPLRENATQAVETAVQEAGKNPWPLVIGAFAVGVFVAMAVARRDTECEPTPAKSMERWLNGARQSLGARIPAMRHQIESKSNGHSLAHHARDFGRKLNLW